MKKSAKFMAAVSLVALGISALPTNSSAEGEKEKCYGVVKAGKNDCGASGHSCAGAATTDGDANEWVYVPAGLCAKLVGGSTEPTKE